MLERRIEGEAPTIGVLRLSGEAAWKDITGEAEGRAGEGGAQRGFAKRHKVREGPMPEQGAMAGSAGRGMAMPSAGRRAVAGAFAFDHGERPRVFGDGAKHRADAANVATLEESANDEGAKRRVVRRETHGGEAERSPRETARPRSGEHEPAMPFVEWRAVRGGRYNACRESKRASGRSHACGEPGAERRRADWFQRRAGAQAAMARSAEPRCETPGTQHKKRPIPRPRAKDRPWQGGRRAAFMLRWSLPEYRAAGLCRQGSR